ncbi:MAG TPA: LPS export ABC transporter periplasmic protein LptC [Steroidobacteraceae bacterium]|jgi:LPS export ABC transporter protein LptC|nr:LPS export ABC transporter periplasmic protein LptC [Steroidobacteraceae bacterium]
MLFRFFTVLAVILLVVSTWILSSPARRQQTQINAKQADLPGYYLKNAVLTDFDPGGEPNIRIEAERIDQIAHGNEVALYNVRVAYQTPNGQSWIMVGDVAHVQPGGKVVDVSGNVRLQSEAMGREGAAVIHTDTLSYNVPDAVASTKSDVRIDYAEHTLTARGLIANLKERTLRLESKVNGRFHP